MRKVDDAVAQFNAMVDVADQDAVKMPPVDPEVAGRPALTRDFKQIGAQARIDTAGLTWAECKPGRDAYKAARRAGGSREEASQASRDALAQVKASKPADRREPG